MDPLSATPDDSTVGWTVRRVTETGSTNDDLLAAGRAGAANRTALVAAHQTAGKGRLDRRWEAPPGTNLLVSMLFRDARPAHELVWAVALGAALAARETAGVSASLKWPNDLLVRRDGDERKLAGILAVAGPPDADRPIGFVVVGLGLNVAWAPDGATSLAAETADGEVVPSVDNVLSALLPAIDRYLDVPPERLLESYRSRLVTLRRKVRVMLPGDEVVDGRTLDVESDGRLVVLDSCGVTRRFAAGDVVHVR